MFLLIFTKAVSGPGNSLQKQTCVIGNDSKQLLHTQVNIYRVQSKISKIEKIELSRNVFGLQYPVSSLLFVNSKQLL